MNKIEHGFVEMSEEAERLLNDNRFLLWCMAPNEKSDLFWNDWLLENPEQREAVAEAKRIVRSLRLNDYRLSEEELECLHVRLLLSLKKRRAIRKQWFIGVAAFLLLLFSLSVWKFLLPDFSEKKIVNSFEVSSLYIDESQTEIELLVKNQEKYLLPNEAKIQLKSSGEIQLEDEKIDSIRDQELEKMKTFPIDQTIKNVDDCCFTSTVFTKKSQNFSFLNFEV